MALNIHNHIARLQTSAKESRQVEAFFTAQCKWLKNVPPLFFISDYFNLAQLSCSVLGDPKEPHWFCVLIGPGALNSILDHDTSHTFLAQGELRGRQEGFRCGGAPRIGGGTRTRTPSSSSTCGSNQRAGRRRWGPAGWPALCPTGKTSISQSFKKL